MSVQAAKRKAGRAVVRVAVRLVAVRLVVARLVAVRLVAARFVAVRVVVVGLAVRVVAVRVVVRLVAVRLVAVRLVAVRLAGVRLVVRREEVREAVMGMIRVPLCVGTAGGRARARLWRDASVATSVPRVGRASGWPHADSERDALHASRNGSTPGEGRISEMRKNPA